MEAISEHFRSIKTSILIYLEPRGDMLLLCRATIEEEGGHIILVVA